MIQKEIIEEILSSVKIETVIGEYVVGIKLKIFDNKSIVPGMSFISQLQLPLLTKSEFRTHIVTPNYYLLFSNKITDRLNIGYNIGVETHEIFDGKFFEYNLKFTPMSSFCITYDIGKDYVFFTEIYNNYIDNTSFDFGFTKTIRNKMQFDISYINGNKSLNIGFVYLF